MRERTHRIVLVISLVLNLFALGAAGGAAVMWLSIRQAPVAAAQHPLQAAADALSPADRDRFRAALRDTLRDARPIQQTARENRLKAADLFVQPTFDADAVNAALARARDADLMLRTRLEGALVNVAKGFPQSERMTLAQALARKGPLRHPTVRPAP
jgi:uncharacterized membrane protein